MPPVRLVGGVMGLPVPVSLAGVGWIGMVPGVVLLSLVKFFSVDVDERLAHAL